MKIASFVVKFICLETRATRERETRNWMNEFQNVASNEEDV